jgi:putative DNA primase/helicase
MANKTEEFKCTEDGVFCEGKYLCRYIEVIAFIRDIENENWKRRVLFKNTFGDFHVLDIGMEQFRNTSDLWKILGKAGFEVLDLENEKLVLKYLKSNTPKQRITSVSKIGWISDKQFICPSFHVIKEKTEDHFSLDSKIRNVGFKIKGELKEWQDNICKYCEGNDILTLAICAAFSGTLLRFTNQSCSVAHLVGKSSIGKTSALAVAASIWGDSRQFIMQWRVTSNAIETLAESHNECLLILDELSQISARDAGNMIYTLGNAKGRARLNSEAEQKEIRQWQISILSSGEIGIADKISENNEKAKAGQLVRFIDIEAEVPNGFGIYNNLHGFGDGAELSNILKANCGKYHGIPAKIFVESLISANNKEENNLEESIKHLYELSQRDICQNFELEKANGQVKRVADVFALYRLAGTLAKGFGIITFDVTKSIYNIFERWVNDRGNKTLSMEENDIVDDVQSFLMQHEARFARISSVEGSYVKDEKVINNCLGGVEDKDNRRIYYVIPKLFRDEICKGKRVKLYRKVLKEKGILLTYEDGSDRRYTINGKRTKMTTLAFTEAGNPCR